MIVDFLKNLNRERIVIAKAIMILVVLLDQISKFFALNAVLTNEKMSLTSFFNIVNVQNKGVILGLFHGFDYSNAFFIFITLLILIILFAILLYEKSLLGFAALCFVIGGAVGNLIDRVLFGAVHDFLDFHFLGFHWPAFNIADAFICIGVLTYLFCCFSAKYNA